MSTLEIILYAILGGATLIYGIITIRKIIRRKKGLPDKKKKDDDEE